MNQLFFKPFVEVWRMRKQVKNLQETYDTAEKGAFVIAITYKFIDLHSTCYMEEYSGNTRIANIVAPHVHAREAWGQNTHYRLGCPVPECGQCALKTKKTNITHNIVFIMKCI